MDGFEIGFFFLSLLKVREVRFRTFLLLRGTKFKHVHTDVRISVRVSVRGLCLDSCKFGFLLLFSSLFEFGLLFVDYSKILIQDFVFRGTLAEEIDLMLKPFAGKCLFTSLCWDFQKTFACSNSVNNGDIIFNLFNCNSVITV